MAVFFEASLAGCTLAASSKTCCARSGFKMPSEFVGASS